MKTSGHATRQFLLAAKRSEIASLKQLAVSCRLATALSAVIHELQRERGISNVWLGSGGERFGEQRTQQVQNVKAAEHGLRDVLGQLGTSPLPGVDSTRLFASIAAALQGLDELQVLRRKIERRTVGTDRALRVFGNLVGALLKVVFEAADVACDPDITRALVTMVNFMQGKEFAGQERAVVAAALAAGELQQRDQERLVHLVLAQERCFEIFLQGARDATRQQWQAMQNSDAMNEFTRLRELVRRLPAGQDVPQALSETWYELATSRIDDMKDIEERLADALLALSQNTLARAKADLRGHHDSLGPMNDPPAPVDPVTLPGAVAEHDETDVVSRRTLYQLINDQRDHLARMSVELDEARRALEDRKWIERAKGLLMSYRGLSEEQAYRHLRMAAMSAGKRLADIAEDVVRHAAGTSASNSRN